MTKFFWSTVIALFCMIAPQAASAIGQHDGIYNIPNTQEYLSVHQNGTTIIIGYFATIPASGIVFYLGDGQQLPPSRVDYWDLFSGPIVGNSVVVTGEIAYGACSSRMGVVFNGSSLSVTQQFISTTPLGTANGINCPGYQNFLVSRRGLTQIYSRVF